MKPHLSRVLLAVAALLAIAAVALVAYRAGLDHTHPTVAVRPQPYARYRDDGYGVFLIFRMLFSIGLIVLLAAGGAALFGSLFGPPRWQSPRRLGEWHRAAHEMTAAAPTSTPEPPGPPEPPAGEATA